MIDARRLIKGRLGEALVATLLQESGWQVRPFGLEKQLASPARPLSSKSVALQHMREFPDFVIYNPSSEFMHPFFVEVKTHVDCPEWSSYMQFGQVLAVWVSPMGIRASWLGRGEPPTADRFRPIEDFEHGFASKTIELDAFHEAARALHVRPIAERGAPVPRSTPTSGTNPAPSGSTPSG